MFDKTLGVGLLFTFIILCLIYGLVFPQDFLRSFFRVLFILYMPDVRIGIIITVLVLYIIYILKKNATNTLNDSDKSNHIIFAVTIALFMNGMLQLLSEAELVNIFDMPFLINKYAFSTMSLIITSIIVIPYIIFIFYSKKTHSLSLPVVNTLFAIASLFLTTIISLKEINMHFDTSKPNVIEGTVESKRMTRAYNPKGYGKLYYVTYSGYEEREVPSSTYREMEVSDKVNMYINDGYLGVKWISKIEKI
ncbi:hypothetical protein [Sulfurovum sp.]|uniref:hypothetical protein n=1 Tax=Sulfurovum sp. TaxID=1969726 RepID=UPI00356152F1